MGQTDIIRLFTKPSRILQVELESELQDGQIILSAIVRFPSHSAARKTLESFSDWNSYKVEWVTINGDVVGDASITKIKEERPPAFCYAVFDPS